MTGPHDFVPCTTMEHGRNVEAQWEWESRIQERIQQGISLGTHPP